LAFEGVRFAYDGRPPALDGVTFTVAAGETVAITGQNGAGKSTLAGLVLRFMDPQEGAVRLDGIDLRELRLEDLRRQVGLVPQRPLLFDGTVRDNIAWGREGATDAEIEDAARLAQAHDFVLSLPDGYGTRVGEHGVRLSGGQGQRVALARALLKDPPILILDEATSMVDLDGEGAFVAAAAQRLRGRTILIITHRPATLALADRRIRLEGGRAIEEPRAA
jgi:ABC-type multidrug transport system fused ATPase/permease subunit